MIKKIHFFFTSFLMIALLAGCGEKEEPLEGSAATNTANTERICPALKDPVCAEINGEKMTFDNGCEANKAGSKTWTRGAC